MAKDQALPPGADGVPQPRKRSRFKFFMLLGSLLLVLGTAGGATYWLFFKQANVSVVDFVGGLFGGNAGESAGGSADGSGSGSAGSSGSSGSAGSAGSADGKDSTRTNTSGRGVPRPVPLPDLTVNLADPGGTRYLKIGMEVELNAPEAAQELTAQNARVRDAIILLLSSKTVAALSSPDGKVLLKNEVAARLNQILGEPRVVRIFFTNFVFQ